jgi:hypothetical protein
MTSRTTTERKRLGGRAQVARTLVRRVEADGSAGGLHPRCSAHFCSRPSSHSTREGAR